MTEQTYPISEVFASIQGEGINTGLRMLFIRFHGCNLNCPWCDTQRKEYTTWKQSDLQQLIHTSTCRWVCFTGGEPGLWLTEELVDIVLAEDKAVALETNGTRWFSFYKKISHITVSPKAAGELSPLWQISSRHWPNEIRLMASEERVLCWPLSSDIQAKNWCVSPMFKSNGKIDKGALIVALEFIKKHPWIRLSVQVHKLLTIP